MTITDKQVGDRVREARESVHLSQMDLAKMVRADGHKWSQATVWSIERGDRPLRLTEATCVAALCAVSLDDLTSASPREPDPGFARGVRASAAAVNALLEKREAKK